MPRPNDEVHCYRERPLTPEEEKALKGDDKTEAKETTKLRVCDQVEAVKRTLGLNMVYDLSAAVFSERFVTAKVRFGWVMRTTSMDAERGIVKLPRVPHTMWNKAKCHVPKSVEHIGKKLPKKGCKTGALSIHKLPNELSAIDVLYGHVKTFDAFGKSPSA
jgi:type III restriction enzyme